MNRQLSIDQIEHAMAVSPKEYPQDMPCMMCQYVWMQHKGTLCPARPGYFDPVTGNPVAPIYQAETTFIPDVAYLNQNPDFDVQ